MFTGNCYTPLRLLSPGRLKLTAPLYRNGVYETKLYGKGTCGLREVRLPKVTELGGGRARVAPRPQDSSHSAHPTTQRTPREADSLVLSTANLPAKS